MESSSLLHSNNSFVHLTQHLYSIVKMKQLSILILLSVACMLTAGVSHANAAAENTHTRADSVTVTVPSESSTPTQATTSTSATSLSVNQVGQGFHDVPSPISVSTSPNARASLSLNPMPTTDSTTGRPDLNQQQPTPVPPPTTTQPNQQPTPPQQQQPVSPPESDSENPEPPAPTMVDVEEELKQAADYSKFLTELREKLQRNDPKAVPEGVEKPTVAEVEEELKQVQAYIDKLNQYKQKLEKGDQVKVKMESSVPQSIQSMSAEFNSDDIDGAAMKSYDDGLIAENLFAPSQYPSSSLRFPPWEPEEGWNPRYEHPCPRGWRGRECRRRRHDMDYWHRCRMYGEC